MSTLLSMALGAAPILGGARLTADAGRLNVPDRRGNRLSIFVVLILVRVPTAGYALRGTLRGLASAGRHRP